MAVDLDGTLVHTVPGEYTMPGRSRDCYVSQKTIALLAKMSQQIPTFITTGRNAPSVRKLTHQIPEVAFAGFVLENGFVVKKDINSPDPQKRTGNLRTRCRRTGKLFRDMNVLSVLFCQRE